MPGPSINHKSGELFNTSASIGTRQTATPFEHTNQAGKQPEDMVIVTLEKQFRTEAVESLEK